MTESPIVVKANFAVPIETVWKAITDEGQMKCWYFESMQRFRPEVGFETEFDVEFEGRVFLHQWKVTEAHKPNRLVYDWKYGGVPGRSQVIWELSESDENTELTVTHCGGETFPQDDPIFSRENGVAGWEYLLHESLPSFLQEPQTIAIQSIEIDTSLRPPFAEAFGNWQAVSGVLAGAAMPDRVIRATQLRLNQDVYEVDLAGTPDRGTCQFQGDDPPFQLVIQGTEGPNAGKTIRAILEVSDDQILKIAYDLSGNAFPTSFEPSSSPDSFVATFSKQ
ncbi:MAG: SRPBCC domain-containing protein [Planctomycetota bacterium]